MESGEFHLGVDSTAVLTFSQYLTFLGISTGNTFYLHVRISVQMHTKYIEKENQINNRKQLLYKSS